MGDDGNPYMTRTPVLKEAMLKEAATKPMPGGGRSRLRPLLAKPDGAPG